MTEDRQGNDSPPEHPSPEEPLDPEEPKVVPGDGEITIGMEEQVTLVSGPGGSLGMPADPGLEPGSDFGPYLLIRVLGKGGFGQVWEAEHRENGRRVALKVLTAMRGASPEAVERFRREGKLSASLNHPRCVFVFGAEEIDGCPAITMELMPGATLQDYLDDQGAMEPRKAVDAALDLLAGLQAAHATGVLHRDIKPSNCFLDAEGNVKVGDFGLSRTLEGDSHLTVTGTFLGTPYYSSPEQVKGRDLDFRSDLYSLGATLFALLTGHPPFEGKGAGEVLARILSEEPRAFGTESANVPQGLQRIVRRLMAKDPVKRYDNHEALRSALLPYSSQVLAPARLGRRAAAALVDGAILFFAVMVMGAFSIGQERQSAAMLAVTGAWLLTHFLYFFVPEALWGHSWGKLLFGLRVTGTAGLTTSGARIALRTAIVVGVMNLDNIFLLLFPGISPGIWTSLLSLLLLVALFSTARRSNGFAGLHELASRTRVRESWEEESRVTVASETPSTSPLPVGEVDTLGPYRPTGILWKTDAEALQTAVDDVLEREVWLHRPAANDLVRPIAALADLRLGRLRWLQGSRRSEKSWDAFEAPSGNSLEAWVSDRGGLGWVETRGVLRCLAAELQAGLEKGDLPAGLSLRHVWVDMTGRALLLEFPWGGREQKEPTGGTGAPAGWRAFLHQLLLFCLEGRRDGFDALDGQRPAVALPEYTRSLVDRLCGLGEGLESPEQLGEELDGMARKPASLTRATRILAMSPGAIAVLALPSIIPIVLLVLLLAPPGAADAVLLGLYGGTLERLQKNKDYDGWEKIRRLQATTYHTLVAYPKGRESLERLPAEHREPLESAAREYPVPLEKDEIQDARAIVGKDIKRGLTRNLPRFLITELTWASLPVLLLVFLLRGGVLFSLFGIAVQRKDGSEAGRLRCTSRAVLVWLPFLLLPFALSAWPALQHTFTRIGLPALWLIGLLYTIWKPERGLQDVIAGTHLVPR